MAKVRSKYAYFSQKVKRFRGAKVQKYGLST